MRRPIASGPDKLKPEWRAELERLGVEGVRLVFLQQGRWDPTVQLWPQVTDSPNRRDVEDWLKAELDRQERRGSVARWTKIAGVAAIAATVLSLAGVAIGLLAWLHP